MNVLNKRILLLAAAMFVSVGQAGAAINDIDQPVLHPAIPLLDEDGNHIEYVYVTTESEEGVQEIEITDDEGDLYEIKNTGYYITFRGFYGFAGFGEEGILVVGKSSWSSTFYKNPN